MNPPPASLPVAGDIQRQESKTSPRETGAGRSIQGEGPCFFHPLRKFPHRLRMSVVLVTLALTGSRVQGQDADGWRATQPRATRFVAVDVFVDSGARPLAAYQFAFFAKRGDVKIVSIEGGEHPAFQEPPYYDPKAIQRERAVLAAFSTASAEKLPTGKSRVATLHLRVNRATALEYKVSLAAAASCDGRPISVECSSRERSAQ